MTPHWYSASPDVQRKLISKFLRSLDLTSAKTPNLTSFEDQLNCTRSIHDVAAVFRWALRHIQLESDCFATNRGWYKAFLDAETANDYPPNTFSQILVPHLPTTHLELLISTLEVFSSLAAFSESNSTSGSKLSKMFGLWLLTTSSVEDKDDWRTFYAKWERTGRMLEHLFLARIRFGVYIIVFRLSWLIHTNMQGPVFASTTANKTPRLSSQVPIHSGSFLSQNGPSAPSLPAIYYCP